MNIVWSDLAIQDFEQNLMFLYDNWNEAVVQNFTAETERILAIIETSPSAFQKYEKNIHFVPITKHVTLFYQVNIDKIELIRFWNNFQRPNKID